METGTSINPDFVTYDDPVHMSVLSDEYIPDKNLPRFSEDRGHVNNYKVATGFVCEGS